MYRLTYLFLFISFLFSKIITHKIAIYDFNENPINNVNISCGEANTISNKNGFFEIDCDINTPIILSHVKYKTFIIQNKALNLIILTEKHLILDDVKIFGGLNTSNKFSNISVINNDKFKLNGKNHLEDLLSSTANLNFSGGTSRAQYYQIRGLGELSQFSGEGPPHFYVGYIIDDIDFSGIGMIGFLDDIKQVEIFKGPQSMAYGPNSMAGIINLVSNEPTDSLDFNTQISFSSNNGYHISSVLSIPIHKKLLSRFTIMNNYTDGMIINKFKNISDSNSKDEKLFRAKFIYTPNNTTEINLTIYNIDLNNKYDAWTPDNNGFITFTDYQGYDKQNTQAFSLKSIFQIDNGTIINISSYSDNKMIYSYDGDWANNEYWHEEPYNWNSDYWGYEWDFPDYTERNRISKSNELKINQIINKDLSSTIGFYLSKTNEKDNRTGYLFAGFADNIKSNFLLKNYAVYIQFTNQINNLSKIIYTLRTDINSTKQNLEFSKYDWYTYTNITDNFSGYIKDKNLYGGSIQYIHSMDEKMSISFSVSRGYKTSGINQTQSSYFLNYENELRYYTTEYSNNLEIGISYVSDNFSYKITNFYLYRMNPQLRLFYQFDLSNPNSFDYATINSDYGYNYGIEADFTAHINNEFSIYATLSTLKTYISKFVFEGNIYGDRETAHSPNSTLSLGVELDLSKYINGLSINFNSYYKSSFYFDDQNNHKSNSHTVSNCSVKYIFKHLELSIWGKNIFNKKYPIRGYTFALDPTFEIRDWQSFADLSTFGLTVNYNF